MTRGEKTKVQYMIKRIKAAEEGLLMSNENKAYDEGYVDALEWILWVFRYNKTGD